MQNSLKIIKTLLYLYNTFLIILRLLCIWLVFYSLFVLNPIQDVQVESRLYSNDSH
jgi:hypothetical protein